MGKQLKTADIEKELRNFKKMIEVVARKRDKFL